MRHVLAIDTCGPVIGVALLSDGTVSTRELRVQRGAEALLVPWCVELCAGAGVSLPEVGGVVVATGPGAFTGVRVGVATAAGLAQAISALTLPFDALVSRAVALAAGGPVLSMLDAKKGRVYAALVDADGSVLRGPADVTADEAVSWAKAPFLATGEGALAFAAVVEAAGGKVAANAASSAVQTLVNAGAAALRRGAGIPVTQLRPYYLRDADAVPPQERT